MPRQRLVPARTAGAVGALGLLAGALAGCGSGTLEVQAPAVSGSVASRCAGLLEALPRSVADQQRRPVSTGAHDYAAAWGDPPIVLRCGVPKPKELNRFATCQQVNGVGWFVPPRQIDRGPGPITMTSIGFQPRVQVQLPGDYWPPAAAMADLAKSVKASLNHTHSCV
ncbi:MAG TPA: DUF3515 domain-containing protein [Nocardioidaceae bacterium]|nr:DUF3515 domain-containing protein [Nocardioidaceae bacterium]